jgi:hypothetical protein
MSFIASCPFCRRKVQAPRRALGQSIACKRCNNFFTVAPDDEAALHHAKTESSSELEIGLKAALPIAPPPTQRTTSMPHDTRGLTPLGSPDAAAPDEKDLSLTETVRQHERITAPILPVLREPPRAQVRPTKLGWHTLGVVAMALGSFALVCAGVSWLQWLTIPLAALGLIAGAFGLIVDYTEKTEEWTPKAGAGISGAVLLIALVWPALLGLDAKITTDLPPPIDPNRQVFQARGDKGSAVVRPTPQPLAAERWVEAEQYDVDHGFVRLRVVGTAVQDVPANLRKDRRRGEKELVLTVMLSHVGTKDPISFPGWRNASAASAPRLTDASGKTLGFHPRSEAGLPPRALVPFHPVQEALAFDVPAAGSEYLRLELPATAFGGIGAVKFQIPKSMIR